MQIYQVKQIMIMVMQQLQIQLLHHYIVIQQEDSYTYQEHQKQSKDLYIYSRDDGTQKLLVVCSFSKEKTVFKAPKSFDLERANLVLQNYDAPRKAVLMPYECRVYLWE